MKGIIALSACLAGEVARFLTRGMYEDAKAAALRYQDIFGKGNFFLELQDHGIPEQQNVNQQLLKYAAERRESIWLSPMTYIIHWQRMQSLMIYFSVFRLDKKLA